MNSEILNEFRQYLRQKYRKKWTIYSYYEFTKLFLQWINKPAKEITKEDMSRWKEHITQTYKPNGNLKRVISVNIFFKWLEKEELRVSYPKPQDSNKIVISDKEIQDYINASKENPLWYLIALLQIDGLLRPSEFSFIKISNIDFENDKLYLDDTKTGNNYIIMSPRVSQAIKDYLPYRYPLPEFQDYLIIIPNGKYKNRVPSPYGDFICLQTKKIAVKAGIKKTVTPYIIKPSVITNDFNKNINPKIIQRKARHKKIESTLKYDHTSDDMVRKHFEAQKINVDILDSKNKAKILFDRYLSGELDFDTFKQSLDLLNGKERKNYEDLGYA